MATHEPTQPGGATPPAFLFDLDGTLIESGADIAAHLNATLAARGHRTFDMPTIMAWTGDGVTRLIERCLHAIGLAGNEASSALRDVREDFLERYAATPVIETVAYDGVTETLTALARRGHALGIVTNKPEAISRAVVDTLGWHDRFGAILGGDSLPERKPDPRPILVACEALGVTPARSVFVGDTEMDFEAARRAGCPVIAGCTWGYRRGHDLLALGATHALERFGDLLDLAGAIDDDKPAAG